MNSDLTILQKSIGYTFRDERLLEHALRHSSYSNEHGMPKTECNERLEFLGDAVLELVCSEFLYDTYPDLPEGKLTRMRASLVCEPALAYDAGEFGLNEYIILGKGEDASGGRQKDSVVSDACEALIGAIYLDGGLAPAKTFILTHILNDHTEKHLFSDSKTALQELSQHRFRVGPVYRIVGEAGPAHQKLFTAQVLINDIVYGEGTGHTKKAAEQNASLEAVRRLKGRN